MTAGDPELKKAVGPAPQAALPKLSNLDEEVARPVQAPTGSTNIEDIHKERLIGRQLRMARRTAQRLRDDQMKGAIESFHDAQIARNEALDRLVTVQQELAVIDSKSSVAYMQGQILALEQEVDQIEKSLAILMENARPNTAKVNAL